MISNPDLRAVPKGQQWPRMFSYWQLLSLVPGLVHRLQRGARVLELEVGGQSLLSGLARAYPASQFIGLTSLERARSGLGVAENSTRNLHFRIVERMELARFRQVDLALALGGVVDRTMLREVARMLTPGGMLVLREEEAFPDRWASPSNVRHTLTQGALSDAFAAVHVVRLPEDPGYFYYIASAA